MGDGGVLVAAAAAARAGTGCGSCGRLLFGAYVPSVGKCLCFLVLLDIFWLVGRLDLVLSVGFARARVTILLFFLCCNV